MNESFWDAHGAEIVARAIFEYFAGSDKFCRHDKKMTESILWVRGWPGVVRRCSRAGWGARATVPRRCARTIENISRIRMVVARASGTDLASSLKRNTFLTLGVRPVERSARDGGTRGGSGTGGHGGGPGRGDTGGPSAMRGVGKGTPPCRS